MFFIVLTITVGGGLFGRPAPLELAVVGYIVTAIIASTLTALIPKLWSRLMLRFTLTYKRAYLISLAAWMPSCLIGLLVHMVTAGGRNMSDVGDWSTVMIAIGEILMISAIFWRLIKRPERRPMSGMKAMLMGFVFYIGALIIGFAFSATITRSIFRAFT